jgi:hypothetical protein
MEGERVAARYWPGTIETPMGRFRERSWGTAANFIL